MAISTKKLNMSLISPRGVCLLLMSVSLGLAGISALPVHAVAEDAVLEAEETFDAEGDVGESEADLYEDAPIFVEELQDGAEDELLSQAYNATTVSLAEGEWSTFELNDSDSAGGFSVCVAEFTLKHRSNVTLYTTYQPTNVGSGTFSVDVVEASGEFSGGIPNRALDNASKTILTSPINDSKVKPRSIPAGRYLVTYTYRNNHDWHGSVNFEVRYVINPLFEDVPRDHWASGVIADAVDRRYMSGYDSSLFGTNDLITRGQVATVLWNMEGRPAVETGTSLGDVPDGLYYSRAVAWASASGIVSGYADGTFRPENYVTRQELATMLHNYAVRFKGAESGGDTSSYESMSDHEEVAPYAQKAMGWCFSRGVLSGSNGWIRPLDTATRAEAAKMFVKVAGLL